MNLIINHIPTNWNPKDQKSMAKWFKKLPIVRDLNHIKEIDEGYHRK
jgi:hypothetical protein